MSTFRIQDLPLYWRMTDTACAPRPEGIPARFDFEFTFDENLGLIKQEVSAELDDVLERIYRADANVGYLQVGQSLSDSYGMDLWRFIEKCFDVRGKPQNALEIGCGGCYVLDLLEKAGVQATGIDPSPVAIRLAESLGLDVVEGFFPHPKAAGPYDLILHSDVLEHVTDPVDFLAKQRECLVDGGLVVVAVPDCTTSNLCGDLSMIIHQHINYFDRISLGAVFRAAGLQPLLIEPSQHGGSLYCLAQKQQARPAREDVNGIQMYNEFCEKAIGVADRFSSALNAAISEGKNVGCYVPLRAFPYLALAGNIEGVNLYDDSAEMADHYFDGVSERIKDFSSLESDPDDLVFVMSYSFGDRIRDKIRAKIGDRTEIVTLSDLSHG